MEICKVFYHLITFYNLRVTLQEQYANSTQALISDLNITCGQLRVIQI